MSSEMQLRDDPLRMQVQQMLADPAAVRARMAGDRELADKVIQHATRLLNN